MGSEQFAEFDHVLIDVNQVRPSQAFSFPLPSFIARMNASLE